MAILSDVQPQPLYDTLSTGVIAVARGCLANFTSAATPADELPHLFNLALLAQQDALAHEILERQLALAPSDSSKNLVRVSAIHGYLTADPARLVMADSLLTQLDKRGRTALVARLRAREEFLELWERAEDSTQEFSVMQQILNIAQQNQGAPELTAMFTCTERSYLCTVDFKEYDVLGDKIWGNYAIWHALGIELERAEFAPPDSLATVVQSVREVLKHVAVDYLHPINWDTCSVGWIYDRVDPLQLIVAGGKDPVRPARVRADFWFPAAGSDTIVPSPGKLSIVYFMRSECSSDNSTMWWFNNCGPDLQMLQSWYRKYGPAGLNITVVDQLYGVRQFGDPESPAQEAVDFRTYIVQYWHLPVTVAIGFRGGMDNTDYIRGGGEFGGVFSIIDTNGNALLLDEDFEEITRTRSGLWYTRQQIIDKIDKELGHRLAIAGQRNQGHNSI